MRFLMDEPSGCGGVVSVNQFIHDMFTLKDKVAYAERAIAKEIIAENKCGTVLMMAVDKGLEIPTHHADADVLVQVVDGTVEFTLEGASMRMSEGDALLMRPRQNHSLRAVERFKVVVTKLNASRC